jgi:hypothetical protein
LFQCRGPRSRRHTRRRGEAADELFPAALAFAEEDGIEKGIPVGKNRALRGERR